MLKKELLGTLALVHPHLEEHYAGREGDIGIVFHINTKGNELYLRFTDGKEAIFDSYGLLVLKNSEKSLPGKGSNAKEMNLDDYKNLYKITLLQNMGRAKDIWRALEIARDNPRIWSDSLISIEKIIDTRYDMFIGR